MKRNFNLLAVLMVSTLAVSVARADNVDPSNLHFGSGQGTGCYAGCAGDPNLINSSGFDIYNVSDSNATNLALTSSNPLLLILAVPNYDAAVSSSNVPTVKFYSTPTTFANNGTATVAAAGSTTYEVSPNTYGFSNTGFNSGSVYKFLNLDPQTDSSNSFANFTLAGNDPTATSFTVYVYDIYGGTLNANGLIQFSFGTALPTGTIATAYTQGLHNGNLTNYDNAFTEAGLVNNTPTPEPGSLLLFGTGLTGLAAFLRKHKIAK